MKGGHGVSEQEIRRRYDSGLLNLQQVNAPRVDMWYVADANAPLDAGLRYIANGGQGIPTTVHDSKAWVEVQQATRATITKSEAPPPTHRSPRRSISTLRTNRR